MCAKRKFNSELAAELAIIRIRAGKKRALIGKVEVRPYRCTQGGTEHWHLTSQQESGKPKPDIINLPTTEGTT